MKQAQQQGWEVTGIEPSKKASNYASNTLGLNVHNLSIERLLDCKFSEKLFRCNIFTWCSRAYEKTRSLFLKCSKTAKKGGVLFYSVAMISALFKRQCWRITT